MICFCCPLHWLHYAHNELTMNNVLKSSFIICFGLLLQLPTVFPNADSGEVVNTQDESESTKAETEKRYKLEISQGDLADLLSNTHQSVPHDYKTFSRRFVLEYPYVEKTEAQIDDEAETRLDQAIREAMKSALKNNDLRPVKAPPELVLAVVKKSIKEQKENPVDPDEFDQREILRSNDFWDSAWKEEVPEPVDKLNLRSTDNKLKSVRVKVMPGSKLYKLISMTRQMSPRLLYIINPNK